MASTSSTKIPARQIIIEIITIIDLARRPKQLLSRLKSLAAAIAGTEFSLVVGHADRRGWADRELQGFFDKSQGKLISFRPQSDGVELARLRNSAMENAESETVLLVDVDIFPDIRLFRSLANSVISGSRIEMAPCIYLTKYGTNKLLKWRDPNSIVSEILKFSPDLITHWAIPSSVIGLSRIDYWAVDGFHEGYFGHGYEDFDFLIHLCLHTNLIQPSADLLMDQTYKAPLLSTGFRALLGRLSIANLLDGTIAFHLHHEKDPASDYIKRRKINSNIFSSRINKLIIDQSKSCAGRSTLELISCFFSECERRSIDPSKFYSLMDASPKKHHFIKHIKNKLAKLSHAITS